MENCPPLNRSCTPFKGFYQNYGSLPQKALCFQSAFLHTLSVISASAGRACKLPSKRKRSRGPSAEAEKDMRKHSRRGYSDAGICDKLPHISVCALLRRGKTCGASAADIPRRFARKLRKKACRMLRRQSFYRKTDSPRKCGAIRKSGGTYEPRYPKNARGRLRYAVCAAVRSCGYGLSRAAVRRGTDKAIS